MLVDGSVTARKLAAGSVTADHIQARAITGDKIRVDHALITNLAASDALIQKLMSKQIVATKIESVITSSTILEGYKGWIGGFQIGRHAAGSGRWITGRNHFSVGMGNGDGGSDTTALWVNWGYSWDRAGDRAWYVKNNGKMYCKNQAEFWRKPIVHSDLQVEGQIVYDGGVWVYSPTYKKIYKEISDGGEWLYLDKQSGKRDWIHMNQRISDRRYKTAIQASQVSGLTVIEKLKTYSYRKEYDGKIEEIACGIMAQDVKEYAPDAFYENPDGAYSYSSFALVPYLIKAIQELDKKIRKMEDKHGA